MPEKQAQPPLPAPTPMPTPDQRRERLRALVESCHPTELLRDLAELYTQHGKASMNQGLSLAAAGRQLFNLSVILDRLADLYGGP